MMTPRMLLFISTKLNLAFIEASFKNGKNSKRTKSHTAIEDVF
ncbi:hypothetical protein PR048_008653 [Dryococelus australis]|uniref:Uncharacterized protein n=1 Tax=Dryococelus australis TaxID=614101 RepID=A0ABQ9HXQ9_9NEOP|nr:hypothetical protein PR048_008653 [Dryococelus australis]